MDIKSFVFCTENLPEDVSVLARGGHGIGKSQVVAQLAEHFKLVLIDKRLSQLSEGDMIGLPVITPDGSTRFAHPDWFVEACDAPRLLFFDELNRALPEVMQAAFQIVLDRTLNGKKLHPGTRIFSAINNDSQYQVNEMDPALLDRFWTADLEPTVEDWLAWAKDKVHPILYSFIQNSRVDSKAGKSVLDPSPKCNPGEVQPSRRSYERLDKVAQKMGFYDADLKGANNPLAQQFFQIAMGFIGTNCANQLVEYTKNLERQVTAEDIVNNWSKTKDRVEMMGQEKWNICIEKVIDFARANIFTDKQAKNVGDFATAVAAGSGELIIHFWTELAKEPNTHSQANIKIIHPYVMPLILPVFGKKAPAAKAV